MGLAENKKWVWRRTKSGGGVVAREQKVGLARTTTGQSDLLGGGLGVCSVAEGMAGHRNDKPNLIEVGLVVFRQSLMGSIRAELLP